MYFRVNAASYKGRFGIIHGLHMPRMRLGDDNSAGGEGLISGTADMYGWLGWVASNAVLHQVLTIQSANVAKLQCK